MVVFIGTGSNDTIDGLNFDDVIYGYQGNDTIHGSFGNDIIYGDNGYAAGSQPAVIGVLGHDGFFTNDAAGLAQYKSEWLSTSIVTIKGASFDGPFTTYTPSGVTTLGTGAAATFGNVYGTGVTGSFSGSSSPIKAEISYDPNTGKSEQISVEWSGGYVDMVSIDFSHLFIAGDKDLGNEAGLVKAYLEGVEVAVTGTRIHDGLASSVTSSGLGIKYVADRDNGDFDLLINGAHFDKLVFSALPYENASESSTTNSSDYLIQELWYQYHVPASASNCYNDSLFGDNGEDTIYGNKGDDYIEGGTGKDLLHGDDGETELLRLVSGGGNDSFSGGVTYNDTISGGGEFDTIYGDEGCDSINGDAGNDLLYGGHGDDGWSGEWDIDSYLAEQTEEGSGNYSRGESNDGSDTIIGGSGRDTIYGEAGNDWIQGGAGDDRLFGGSGNDTFYFESTAMGRDVIHDFHGGDSFSFDSFSSSRIRSEADKIDLSAAGIEQNELDANDDGIINFKDVLIFNGDMIITFDPLPVYHNYIVINNTTELSVSDFIFAGGDA